MACEITQIDGEVIYIRLTGIMKSTDQQSMQDAGKKLIDQGIKPRLLVTIHAFEGWEKGSDWGDVGFMLTAGKNIAKIALVGDERWRDDAFAFTGKGIRSTEIEFFSAASAKEAENWIRS